MEEKIDAYLDLSEVERQELEIQIGNNARWKKQLDAVKWLEYQIKRAQRIHKMEIDSELIASIVANDHYNPNFSKNFEAQKKVIYNTPELLQEYNSYKTFLNVREKESKSFAQFEKIYGYKPSQQKPSSGFTLFSINIPSSIAAALAIVCVYALLFFGSRQFQSESGKLASFDAYQEEMGMRPMRGIGEDQDMNYNEALNILLASQTSYLGLFPHYDEPKVEKAINILERFLSISDTNIEEGLRLNAEFYLGKAYLALDNTEMAIPHLEQVVQGNGSKTKDAQSILEQLSQ